MSPFHCSVRIAKNSGTDCWRAERVHWFMAAEWTLHPSRTNSVGATIRCYRTTFVRRDYAIGTRSTVPRETFKKNAMPLQKAKTPLA